MKNKMWEIIFALLLVIGIIVCTICDIAMSNTYTWSLVPMTSIVFAWVAILPIRRLGKKGIIGSIVILNICIMTYLYALQNLVKDTELIFTVGTRMGVISIIYLGCIFGIFKIFKKRKFLAIGLSLFIGIPICIIINVTLSKMFSQDLLDIWDLLSILTLFVLSMVFFMRELNNSGD